MQLSDAITKFSSLRVFVFYAGSWSRARTRRTTLTPPSVTKLQLIRTGYLHSLPGKFRLVFFSAFSGSLPAPISPEISRPDSW